MSPKLKAELDFYAEFHQNPVNERIHKICVPVIAATTLIFLSYFPLAFLAPNQASLNLPDGQSVVFLPTIPYLGLNYNLGYIAFVGAMIYYLRLDLKWGALMSLYALSFVIGKLMLAWQITVAAFVLAWIFQFIGHFVYEKRSPAFATTPHQLLIGPIFYMAMLFGYRPGLPNKPAA